MYLLELLCILVLQVSFVVTAVEAWLAVSSDFIITAEQHTLTYTTLQRSQKKKKKKIWWNFFF